MEPARKKGPTVPALGDSEKDNQKEKWASTLTEINQKLARYGLPPLSTLGNYLDHQDEIMGLGNVHGYGASLKHPEPYFYVLEFWCKRHGEEVRPYAVMVNATHTMLPGEAQDVAATGAVCFTTFNDEWAVLVRQHRGATAHDWTLEIPRGFIPAGGLTFGRLPKPRNFQPMDMDLRGVTASDLPLGIAKQELGAFLRDGRITAEKLTLLAFPWENTGASSNITPVFHLSLRGDPEFVTNARVWSAALGTRRMGPKQCEVIFAPLSRLEDDFTAIGLNSFHCFGTLKLYEKYRRAERA